MATPILCAENLFDDLMFSGHTVTASTEATGFEADRVANNRRSVRDYWKPTASGTDAWVKVDCKKARPANFFALDRGHNLDDHAIKVQYSDDDSAWTTAFSDAVPGYTKPDADPSASRGAKTEEGAWVRTWTAASARYWRVFIPGATDFTPQVVGAAIGLSWTTGSTEYPDEPFDEDGTTGVWEVAQNDQGWSAHSSDAAPRSGTLSIRLSSFADYDDTVRHFVDAYRTGRPVWVVPDSAMAERAMLVKAPPQARIEAPYTGSWGYRTVVLPYMEHEPHLEGLTPAVATSLRLDDVGSKIVLKDTYGSLTAQRYIVSSGGKMFLSDTETGAVTVKRYGDRIILES